MDESARGAAYLRKDGAIAILTLNRPERLNAINDVARSELQQRLAELAASPDCRAVVVTGAGRAFCAGGDLSDMPKRLNVPAGEIGAHGWSRLHRNQQLVLDLHRLGKPTIAAVNGAAAGLGLDLALACDFIAAARTATFQMSYVLRGLVPDGGGMHFLPRRIGIARAKALIFSGKPVDGEEALQMGLIDRLTAPESLMNEACAWASELAGKSATAVALAKVLLNASFESTLEQSLAAGNQAQAICYTTVEHRQSVEDFLNKRRK